MPNGVKIKLAYGSVASQVCKIVQINVSRILNKFSNSVPLTFLVVKGPHCLIGRHSLQKLYPRQFNAFKQVTSQNVKAFDKLSQAPTQVISSVAKVTPVKTIKNKSKSVSSVVNNVSDNSRKMLCVKLMVKLNLIVILLFLM